MEKRLVKKPKCLDDLPKMEEIIYYMPIDNPIFKNRSMKIFDWTKGIEVLHADTPVPDNLIICDVCNWNIATDEPEKIPLLCDIETFTGNAVVKKALCQKCVDKYYPEHLYIGKPKGSE